MQESTKKLLLTISLSITACAIYSIFSLIVSNYLFTSIVKIMLFTIIPILYFSIFDKGRVKALFLHKYKKSILISFILAFAIFSIIIIGFILLNSFLSNKDILRTINENKITKTTYPIVFCYIIFINAFLEEFFFRGFIYLNLKNHGLGKFAYLFSAVLFSLYHIVIVENAVEPIILLLMLIGLFIAGLIFNEATRRTQSIYSSLILHIGANLALNSIVAYYFYVNA